MSLRSVPECMPEWREDCSQIDCCGDMHCGEHGDGFHQCHNLPKCMPEWEDCSFGVGCCGDLTCVLRGFDDLRRAASQGQATCASNWNTCSDDESCCDSSYAYVHERALGIAVQIQESAALDCFLLWL
jgi:hypothetical protein